MIHVLYVVSFRDDVEFNIECARWNSVAGVTFGTQPRGGRCSSVCLPF